MEEYKRYKMFLMLNILRRYGKAEVESVLLVYHTLTQTWYRCTDMYQIDAMNGTVWHVCLTLSGLTDEWPEFPDQVSLMFQLWMKTCDLTAQSFVCLLHAPFPEKDHNFHSNMFVIWSFSSQEVSWIFEVLISKTRSHQVNMAPFMLLQFCL